MDTLAHLSQQIKKLTFNENGEYDGRKWKATDAAALKSEIDALEIDAMLTFKEKVYALLSGIYIRPKCYCGNYTNLISTVQGFSTFCSKKCSAQSDMTKLNRAKTNTDKFGVQNPFQSTTIKEKIKTTIKQKYGVDSISKVDNIKNLKRHTMLTRYGVDNPGRIESAKEKSKKTCSERYGSDFAISASSVREKIKRVCLDKYGADTPLKNQEVRQSLKRAMVEKYGVEYSSQIPHVKLKKKEAIRTRYLADTLPIRIEQLNMNSIQPVGWGPNEYTNQDKMYDFVHTTCGTNFAGQFRDGKIPACPTCVTSKRSKIEAALFESVKSYLPNAESNDRRLLKGKEVDILIGDIGVEVNGVYWHSENNEYTSLLEKSRLFEEAGAKKLLHFWDYELDKKFDVCLSMILSKCNFNLARIYARNCCIREISTKQASIFLNENHLQGSCPAFEKIGLFHEEELVMVMTIRKSMFSKKATYEIARMASKKFTSVIGGASRLFKYAKQKYPNDSFISYADLRYSTGAVYKQLGFKLLGKTPPNYKWVKGDKIISRYSAQKHKLLKLGNFDAALSETEIMSSLGFVKIKDCGSLVFVHDQ